MAEEPDFNELNKDGQMSADELNAELNRYAEALRQEMQTTIDDDTSGETVEEAIRTFFKKNAPALAAQIYWLANNADAETVKLNACKYGIELAIQAEKDAADPIADLIKSLQANDGKVPTDKEVDTVE